MNIHALLSMQQGQSHQATSASRSDNAQTNGFMQAFSQASHTSLNQNAQAASGQAKNSTGTASLQQIADQLQALGLSEEQLQQADMQALMEQIRQQPSLMNALHALTATLDGNTDADALLDAALLQGEQSNSASPLAEISQRLQLMSAFEDASDNTSMRDRLQQEQQELASALERLETQQPQATSLTALVNAASKGEGAILSDEQQQLAQTLASALERLETQQPQVASLTALFNAASESEGAILSNEQQQLAQTLASALERLETQQPQAGSLMALFNAASEGESAILSNEQQQLAQTLASALEALSGNSDELAEQLTALLSGVAVMQNNSANITAAANSSTEFSASTLFSPSLAAMRGNAQASDAASQSEAANRALSLLDGTSANNTSRISSEALFAALSSTHNSSPAPNFELPAALQASLNGGGSPAAALQNSASGLSQGAAQGNVATPVSSPAWPQHLGQQLVQFAQRGGEQQVQLQLHPAELGPLSISLKVSEQGTQAHFLSANAQVRQVIEQAIPQLREALAEQGISLGDTSVGEQRQQNAESELADGNGHAAGQAGSVEGDNEDASEQASRQPRTVTIDGRVDLYA
ncbi:flagellar hook-length control protein FliK [Halomonas vilamensis]|uniref:Flagellar hook-length control protein FliK n=1 Tax=Vreelandella vilamensis TaxID=531309 RepID=A0ABU1H370_9GAMM|nr:flagellar hook-length control protein FliK [Halomonas vilamensis]MDR5898741.1 flagellar hook-length control protein FliK [Halomonas vilamensis]